MSRFIPLALLSALVALALLPAQSHAAAKTNVAVGIGDQNAPMFDNAAFRALKIKKARYFVKWNAIDDPSGELRKVDEWVRKARQRGVRPFLHIDGVFTKKLPSQREYRSKVGRLVRRLRAKGVRDWGAWNEVNSPTQPTYRNPKRVAQYFTTMRSICKGCTIVALDVLDTGNMKSYIRRFYAALGRRRSQAKIVGIHNYGDTNRNKRNTRLIINEVRRYNRRTQFWMTETGGIMFAQNDRGVTFKCSPSRQSSAIRKMFRLAKQYRRYVKRLYSYNFYGTDCATRQDVGLADSQGNPRPAYNTFRRELRRFKR